MNRKEEIYYRAPVYESTNNTYIDCQFPTAFTP